MLDFKEGTKHEDILKLQTSMLLGGMREEREFVTCIPQKASTGLMPCSKKCHSFQKLLSGNRSANLQAKSLAHSPPTCMEAEA